MLDRKHVNIRVYSIEYMSGLGIDSVTDEILRREREFKNKMVNTKER